MRALITGMVQHPSNEIYLTVDNLFEALKLGWGGRKNDTKQWHSVAVHLRAHPQNMLSKTGRGEGWCISCTRLFLVGSRTFTLDSLFYDITYIHSMSATFTCVVRNEWYVSLRK